MDGGHARRAGTTSRYAEVSRRSVLAALALGAGGALVACSDGDEAALGGTQAADGAGGAGSSGDAAPAEGAVPAGAALEIRFAFAVGDQGRGPARNPYIAVWIETPAEEVITTILVWHLQQNERWLGELKRWYSVAGGGDASVSSATRVPGEYAVQWDCADSSGSRVAAGEYYVCIEASREHGPYELIREPITLGTSPAEKAFPPSGELTTASVVYTL
jgi:hypothetical protein